VEFHKRVFVLTETKEINVGIRGEKDAKVAIMCRGRY
jgi:hypothetical protein